MGRILYGGQGIEIEMDDRAMAHLQAVIASKLRRGESFFLNWKNGAGDGDGGNGHSSAWIAPHIPLYFQYDGDRSIELNRRWLEAMTVGANSNGGLHLGEEPAFTASIPTVGPAGDPGSGDGNGGSN